MNNETPLRSTPFGRYLLLEELAQGGMARVYRAVLREASGFEKTVALKRILRELGEDPEFVTRFTDEARIASTLNHSNIVQVFDFGQVDGEYYLAMELVDGPDLGTLIGACRQQEQPIPIPTALFIAAEMARGLGAAHARRDERGQRTPVVHRDVSPQNLLLSRSGEAKLVDFGIAKAAEQAIRTRTGLIMGKCHYMAPEQATGKTVDSRADIFSAGCVLFQLLTGSPPFSGRQPKEVLSQVISAPIAAPSDDNPDVPPELDEIVGRCLDRDVDARYPDGASLARDLETLLHRITPDFSRDDLAQFIATIVPPKPRPDAREAALTRTVDGGPPALDANEADPALADTVIDEASEPLAAGDPGAAKPAPSSAKTEPEQLPTRRPAETLEVTRTPQIDAASGDRRIGPVLLAVAVLLGAGVGLVATWLTASPAPDPTPERSVLEQEGWRIEVKKLERSPDRELMVLRIALARRDGRVGENAAGRLSLSSPPDAPPQRPRFWTDEEGELLVAFPLQAKAADRHKLTFAPSAGKPLTLQLRERSTR
jgi:eukaryotic-like serine/threonine-protein kinase